MLEVVDMHAQGLPELLDAVFVPRGVAPSDVLHQESRKLRGQKGEAVPQAFDRNVERLQVLRRGGRCDRPLQPVVHVVGGAAGAHTPVGQLEELRRLAMVRTKTLSVEGFLPLAQASVQGSEDGTIGCEMLDADAGRAGLPQERKEPNGCAEQVPHGLARSQGQRVPHENGHPVLPRRCAHLEEAPLHQQLMKDLATTDDHLGT